MGPLNFLPLVDIVIIIIIMDKGGGTTKLFSNISPVSTEIIENENQAFLLFSFFYYFQTFSSFPIKDITSLINLINENNILISLLKYFTVS